MTPTEAYRAALEAAATLAAGMKAPIQDAANIAIGLPAYSKTVAALIRAMPEPEGLDDADELDSLRAENERLRALAVKAQWALQPFADCVFNDNGDMTVTMSHKVTSGDTMLDAYFAYKAIRAALKGGE